MQLGAIVAALDRAGLLVRAPAEAAAIEITGLTSDSRKVERGTLFCAVRGAVQDGHAFVAAAAAAGAAAALVEHEVAAPLVPVMVRDGRRAAAVAAETWFDRPAARLDLRDCPCRARRATSRRQARSTSRPRLRR